MYKVMTKLHTRKENVYAFHMVEDENGEKVEYEAKTPEEAAETAISLLGRVGYEDLRIVDDKSYYIDLIYGEKPGPGPRYYTIRYMNIEDYEPDQEVIRHIEPGATVESMITFLRPELMASFHLIVDGVEYPDGNPDWISFEPITDTDVLIIYSNITSNHDVEIVIDPIPYSM